MKSSIAMIQDAKTADQVRAIVNYVNWSQPTGAMRRMVLRIARKRIQDIERDRV